jgi:hypothetical protein
MLSDFMRPHPSATSAEAYGYYLGLPNMAPNGPESSIAGVARKAMSTHWRRENCGCSGRAGARRYPKRFNEIKKLGSTLWQAVEPLGSWARTHVRKILASRKAFDERDAG